MAVPSAVTEFARLLEGYKRRSGRSYAALAARVGISGSTLHRYCRGAGVPAEFALVAGFAAACGASRDELAELQRRWVRAEVAYREWPQRDGAPDRVDRPALEPTVVVPAQLPMTPAGFTGRVAELARLDELGPDLGPGTGAGAGNPLVILAIAGTAGVGKTALALHWAHRVRARFPDGQLYVNLRGFDRSGSVMCPDEAIRGFLDAFGVPPQRLPVGVDAQVSLYRSLLADKRVLVVLDNARDAEQVRPLLPGAPGSLAMVTSRDQLFGLVAVEGARPMTLHPLDAADARRLLAARLGAARLAAEPRAVDEMIDCCAGLPLALAIVAARGATHPDFPLEVLAAELRDARSRGSGLDVFGAGDTAADARAVFSWSYRTLSAEAASLFRLLGLHPGPDIALPAAASLIGAPAGWVRPLLAELARAHLAVEHLPGRYASHDLLRAHAAELVATFVPAADRRAAEHRMLDHYLHTAYTADRLLDPHRDPITLDPARSGVTPEEFAAEGPALTWFTTELPVLLAAIRHAAGTGFDTHAWRLAWTLGNFFDRQGHWRDWLAAQRIVLEAAQRLGDARGEALAHRALGRAHTRLGDYDEAYLHLRRALDLLAGLGDGTGQAQAHLMVAFLLSRQGHHPQALGHARDALNLYEAAGHRVGHARSLNAVGWHHAQLGDYRQAITCCEQALTMFHDLGDGPGRAATWNSLGDATSSSASKHRRSTAISAPWTCTGISGTATTRPPR